MPEAGYKILDADENSSRVAELRQPTKDNAAMRRTTITNLNKMPKERSMFALQCGKILDWKRGTAASYAGTGWKPVLASEFDGQFHPCGYKGFVRSDGLTLMEFSIRDIRPQLLTARK